MDPKEQMKVLIKNSTQAIYGYVTMCVFFLSIQTFVYFKYISGFNISFLSIATVMIFFSYKLVMSENKNRQKLIAISKRIK